MKSFIKTVIAFTLIVLVFLPMLLYLNPFAWGMRKKPDYEPSLKTEKLLADLKQKYNLDISIGSDVDTLWYFRDLKHKKITQLKSFELQLWNNEQKIIDSIAIKNFAHDFVKNFEHKESFDSLKIVTYHPTMNIYKIKIKFNND